MSRIERLSEALKSALGPDVVLANRPLARHTTLQVGGPADLLVEARSVVALTQSVRTSLELGVPYRVLGSGANVLVSDSGVRGLVVLNRAKSVSHTPEGVKAESGAALAQVARQCVRARQTGLEWAVGIPGTVGGAVIGNAGANGGCVADGLLSAAVLGPHGTVAEWPVERFAYGYRTSALKYQPPGAGPQSIVLSAMFRLEPADQGVLETRVACFLARRAATQPSGASCGSVFRNPPGDYAGRLIEAAGLKGTQLGDAQISPVHANFIINLGEASASSVKTLIDRAQEQVWSQFGVRLELEVELVGDW